MTWLDKLRAEYNELKAEHNETFTFVCASIECASVIEGKFRVIARIWNGIFQEASNHYAA